MKLSRILPVIRAAGATLSRARLTVVTWAALALPGLAAQGADSSTPGGACSPSWLSTFGPRGVDGHVEAIAVHDDGSAATLYVAGNFQTASNVSTSRIARWNGRRWSPLGSGLDGPGLALASYDDGAGPALYAAGEFSSAGGVPANHVARWNGATWTAAGSGTDGDVFALAVFDDGSGPALYAGGAYTSAGGVPASHLARWDGASWEPVGGGTDAPVRALIVHDDGGGPALYVGGNFTTAGGVVVDRLAKWDGASWTPVGSGLDGAVRALATHGTELYAGGFFHSAGGVAAEHIARWDGSSWSPLGAGLDGLVRSIAVYDDGSGPVLHAGGDFSFRSHVARWDGAVWQWMSGGASDDVRALTVHDDGGGPDLYAGGAFTNTSGVPATHVARWNGTRWTSLGSGAPAGHVRALTVHDDGSGTALYAGGDFRSAGITTSTRFVGKWDGVMWRILGVGMDDSVRALTVHDEGGGPMLFAGGDFSTADGLPASFVARWDGTSWSDLAIGMNDQVLALATYDDGSGPALYAGGNFTSAGGIAASRIAKWDGSSWSPLGSGTNGEVEALAVYDDGSGPALYVGGFYTTAGGVAANRIARWDGSSWTALGSGMNSAVSALAVHDDGSGPALFAGGNFTAAGEIAASHVARWSGATWSPLATGTGGFAVKSFAVHDDGSGTALYVGGNFTDAGGEPCNRIARWDGSAWSALGNGIEDNAVLALAVYDDGAGPALYAGGSFFAAESGDAHIAQWVCDETQPSYEATATTWNGEGINVDVLQASAIAIGRGWELGIVLAHAHGASGPTNIKVRTSCINGPTLSSPSGHPFEVLIGGPLALALFDAHDGASADHEPDFAVPYDLSLLGLVWAAQGTVLGGGRADLTTARCGVVGSLDDVPDP